MPLFYLLLLLHCTNFLFTQRENAEPTIQRRVLAAYEREEALKNTLTAVRTRIRERLPTPEMLLEFDAVFSGFVKKDLNKKAFSKEMQEFVNSVLPLDSLAQLITNWQLYRLQSLRLINYSLTKENVAASAFTDTSEMIQYLSFFDIQQGDGVGELGAGSGWMSVLISILYDSIYLNINELGDYNVRQVRRNLYQELTKAQLARCQFAVGSKNSTGLETEDLDLIIAIDAFHHFSDKISMLQSIKWSLAKEGRLCLVEQVKTIDTGDYYCPQALEKWELEELMRQNGFVKTKERRLSGNRGNNIFLLEYRVHSL